MEQICSITFTQRMNGTDSQLSTQCQALTHVANSVRCTLQPNSIAVLVRHGGALLNTPGDKYPALKYPYSQPGLLRQSVLPLWTADGTLSGNKIGRRQTSQVAQGRQAADSIALSSDERALRSGLECICDNAMGVIGC